MLDLQSHFLFDFLEALDGKFKVFLTVPCGDLRTDARLAHGYNGVAEAYYIYDLSSMRAANSCAVRAS